MVGRVAQLDGIRGVAIAAILAVHVSEFLVPGSHGRPMIYAFCRLLFGGWLGVDIFFVLSGFLITRNILEERDRPDFWSRFYLHRSLRILPVFAVVFIAVLAMLHFLNPETKLSAAILLPAIFFSENWTVLNNTGMPMLPHLWSLAVEEQFYLAWPQLVTRCSAAAVLRVSLVLAVSCELLRVGLKFAHVDPWITYAITPTRIDGLCVGAALAAAMTIAGLRAWLLLHGRKVLIGAAILLLTVWLIFRGVFFPNDALTQICAIPPTVVLTAMLIHSSVTASISRWWLRLLANPLLSYLGRRSYALYLIHYPVMLVVWQSRGKGLLYRLPHSFTFDLLITVGALIVSLLLSELSWWVIEAPSLRLRRRLDLRRVPVYR